MTPREEAKALEMAMAREWLATHWITPDNLGPCFAEYALDRLEAVTKERDEAREAHQVELVAARARNGSPRRDLEAAAKDNARLRAAMGKMTERLVAFVSKHGEDWRDRLPKWYDTLSYTERFVYDLAVIGENALAHPAPEAVQAAQAERELDRAARELAEAHMAPLSLGKIKRLNAADAAYRALRDRAGAAKPGKEGA